jgi:transcriptional regulator with XRE-family HTH domain
MSLPLNSKEFIHGTLRLEIGRILKNFRDKKGYSQNELAILMNISRATISKIENGKFAISVDYLEKFAWFLDFDVKIFDKEQLKQK